MVAWRPEWDLYLRAVDRAEHKAREEVREMFYGRRRSPALIAAVERSDSAGDDDTFDDLDRKLSRLELRNDEMDEMARKRDLEHGITTADRERMRAESDAGRAERVITMRAENDALEAELLRKRNVRAV